MKATHFAITDVGLKRTNNEDFLLVDEELGLYMVADGLGGHAYGEVASRMALETVHDYFDNNPDVTEEELQSEHEFPDNVPLAGRKLIYSIMCANTAVMDAAKKDSEMEGMGTTLVAALLYEGAIFMAHVGDSRIYRFYNDTLEQMTEDHSFLNEQLKLKKYSRKEIESSPMKYKLARAIGHMSQPRVDLKALRPKDGDIYLLCSDGLTNMLDDDKITQVIRALKGDLEKAGKKLVELAKEKGGVDNITAILLKFDEE